MTGDDGFSEWLKLAAKGSGDKIKGSDIFLSLFTKSYEKDPLCALQLGIAIMLDKPIYLLVPEGTELPMNMQLLARGIETFDPDDPASVKAAGQRLVKFAKEAL